MAPLTAVRGGRHEVKKAEKRAPFGDCAPDRCGKLISVHQVLKSGCLGAPPRPAGIFGQASGPSSCSASRSGDVFCGSLSAVETGLQEKRRMPPGTRSSIGSAAIKVQGYMLEIEHFSLFSTLQNISLPVFHHNMTNEIVNGTTGLETQFASPNIRKRRGSTTWQRESNEKQIIVRLLFRVIAYAFCDSELLDEFSEVLDEIGRRAGDDGLQYDTNREFETEIIQSAYVPPHMRNAQRAASSPSLPSGNGWNDSRSSTPPAQSSYDGSNGFSDRGAARGGGGFSASPRGGGGGGGWGASSNAAPNWSSAPSQPREAAGFGTWKEGKHIVGQRNPRIEKELFGDVADPSKQHTGINFEKYDDIPVEATGADVPDPVTVFTSPPLDPVLLENIGYARYTSPTPVHSVLNSCHGPKGNARRRGLLHCAALTGASGGRHVARVVPAPTLDANDARASTRTRRWRVGYEASTPHPHARAVDDVAAVGGASARAPGACGTRRRVQKRLLALARGCKSDEQRGAAFADGAGRARREALCPRTRGDALREAAEDERGVRGVQPPSVLPHVDPLGKEGTSSPPGDEAAPARYFTWAWSGTAHKRVGDGLECGGSGSPAVHIEAGAEDAEERMYLLCLRNGEFPKTEMKNLYLYRVRIAAPGYTSTTQDYVMTPATTGATALRENPGFADEMRDWKEWALSYLSRRILQPEQTIIFGLSSKGQHRTPLMGLPVRDLAALHGLYHRLEGNEAYCGLNLIIRVWCVRVETKELPVSGALDAAAACGDSETLAGLYCVQLRRMKGHARMLERTPFPVDNISPIHFQCMFAGYCSLSLAWDRLQDKAVPFPFVTGTCASDREHTTQCIPCYQTQWKEAIHVAEGQCPDVTKMLDRVSSVIQHLRNCRGLENGKKWECFHDFTRFTGGLSTALQDLNLTAHCFFPEMKHSLPVKKRGVHLLTECLAPGVAVHLALPIRIVAVVLSSISSQTHPFSVPTTPRTFSTSSTWPPRGPTAPTPSRRHSDLRLRLHRESLNEMQARAQCDGLRAQNIVLDAEKEW
ncbi:hypothetical protein DFH09DRAFT_1448868 [Mycena vulgaris]|nr:hypothetical protein DFH09DRAFT_1448868 [Mycena vulgaris]